MCVARLSELCNFLLTAGAGPVAKLLTKILGPHSGIIYRRAELKELVNLHGISGAHGGDLNRDVVTIVGAWCAWLYQDQR